MLTKKESDFLAELLNEKVADLNWEYDDRILQIQKKLNLYPRKERWVLCGVLYVTVVEHEDAVMKWIGPMVSCHAKVRRLYIDSIHN